MEKLRLSFIILVAFGFLCTVDSNPISAIFRKSDDKAEADDKEAVTTAKTAEEATTTTTAATTTTTTTTATPEPGSSCGGLKGFLHLCEKSEPTEPPKSVKVRSVPEKDDDDDDDDESDSNSDENSKDEEEKKDVTEASSVVSEPTEGVAKRQVGDSEAPILSEVPPMVGDAMSPPIVPSEEEDGTVAKRQADESGNEEEETDEVTEVSRKRRDCRDRDGDYVKDCRKKREYVPCVGIKCGATEVTTESQLK